MLNDFKKNLFVLSLFLMLILTLGLVSAAQDSDNMTSAADFTGDDCQMSIEDNDDIISESYYSELLSDNVTIDGGTFDDIQNAVDEADDGDIIELSGKFTSTGSAINISKNITLKGNAVLDAKGLSGIIHFTGKNIYLNGLTFINSNNERGAISTSVYVGEIFNNIFDSSNDDYLKELSFRAENCIFRDNVGKFCGSLFIYHYTTSLTNCEFTGNSGKNVGAVIIRSDDVTISNCNFESNSADWNSDLQDYSSNFISSDAVGAASILYCKKCIISDSRFTGNTAKNYYGRSTIGALYVAANCSIKNCRFENNNVQGRSKDLDGAGLFHEGYNFYCTVEDSTFINNIASTNQARGGAITSSGEGLCTVLNCYFKDNQVKTRDHDGGAIYAYSAVVRDCNFINNGADWGGAVSVSILTAEKCTFTSNYAKQYGGAINTYNAIINDCVFSKNTAKKYGGAIYGTYSVFVKNSQFSGNVAQGYGSAIGMWAVKSGEISVSNSKFSNNVANAMGTTYDYPFKNYGNGAIFHLGYLENFKCSIKNSNGITKNSDKFKDKTEISASKVLKVSKGGYLTVGIKDSKGNAIKGLKLTVKINGKKFKKVTNNKGEINVLVKMPSKTYSAKISFAGNNFYIKSSKSIKVVVKKPTPKLVAEKKTFKHNVKVKKYTATLKNGNKALKKMKLKLKINGKTFSAKTNKKGDATFKITKLNKKGNYNTVISYDGNKNYNKITKKVKITIE